MRGKTYEAELPPGYRAALVFDAKNKKTAAVINICALLVTVVLAVLFVVIAHPFDGDGAISTGSGEIISGILVRYLIFMVLIFAYMILHELTHGAAYWLLTRHRLKFGMTLSVAYCGVPDIFVYRAPALIAVLAPFCVFVPVFLLPMLLLGNGIDRAIAACMLAIHTGGCVGDIYDALLLIFKFRSPDTLVQDTGPRQTFYVK